jgi:hypothetical protein
MYVAKSEGGDAATMFASTMHTSAIDRLGSAPSSSA